MQKQPEGIEQEYGRLHVRYARCPGYCYVLVERSILIEEEGRQESESDQSDDAQHRHNDGGEYDGIPR